MLAASMNYFPSKIETLDAIEVDGFLNLFKSLRTYTSQFLKLFVYGNHCELTVENYGDFQGLNNH